MPPGGDLSIDIADIYAFQKPGDATKSILMANVNPLALAPAFRSNALDEIRGDTNGDAPAEIAFRIRFSPASGAVQSATVRRAAGPMAIGIGTARGERSSSFPAVGGLPTGPIPPYPSYVIEGHVDLASRSGVLTKTVFAGPRGRGARRPSLACRGPSGSRTRDGTAGG